MTKKLSEMTLAELWQLFPVVLSEPCDVWESWYAQEACALEMAFQCVSPRRISHIGSTAISGIWAKPIVDILVEVAPERSLEPLVNILEGQGYTLMSRNGNRFSFNKGYTEHGFAERVFHLHLRHLGDNDELYFRDYLNGHPQEARAYEALKRALWKRYEHDRDGYTSAKTEFVQKCTLLARKLYGKRYG